MPPTGGTAPWLPLLGLIAAGTAMIALVALVASVGLARGESVGEPPATEVASGDARVHGAAAARPGAASVLLSQMLESGAIGAGIAVGMPGVVAAGLLRRRQRRDGRARLRARVSEAADQLAAEAGAGIPVTAGLAHLAERWPRLQVVSRAAEWGADVPAAWRAVADEPGAEGCALIGAAWALGTDAGGSLRTALAAVAQELRAEQDVGRTVEGELASARATGRLVAGLPIVAICAGSALGARPVEFLFTRASGLVCLTLGLTLAAVGLWWIEALADSPHDLGRPRGSARSGRAGGQR